MGCRELTYQPILESCLKVVHNNFSNDKEKLVDLKRYRYNGKEKDEESGLYYYGMRYYAPWLCRFVSVDPLAAEYKHYSPYQYAGNKPINFIDLDGAEELLPQGSKCILPGQGGCHYKPVATQQSINPNQSVGHTMDKISMPLTEKQKKVVGGASNIVVGLATTIGGFTAAVATSPSGVGAFAGTAVAVGGIGQMTIGLAQIADTYSDKVNNPALDGVSGLGELAGNMKTIETGDPSYRMIGAGFDLVSSGIGIGLAEKSLAKGLPVLSNAASSVKNLKGGKTLMGLGELEGVRNDYNTIKGNFDNITSYYSQTVTTQETSAGTTDNISQTITTIEIINYTIQSGDTLSEIAEQFGTDTNTLAEMNGIADANKINAGDTITVNMKVNQVTKTISQSKGNNNGANQAKQSGGGSASKK